MSARKQLASAMTETELKDAVIEMAQRFGWLVHHDRPARTEKGWRTAIQGDKGFPDLVLARAGVVIFAELKSAKGKISGEQGRWIEALTPKKEQADCDHLAFIWWPGDWHNGTIRGVLE